MRVVRGADLPDHLEARHAWHLDVEQSHVGTQPPAQSEGCLSIAGLADDRIIRIPTSDNFWAMGDTGPCGPCSEIFIDRGEHIWGGPPGSPEEDGDRFLEFWNLVFMQYEQVTKEERVPLPRPSIDTGMGLERMASILQGVESVFETDLFQPILARIETLSGHRYGGTMEPADFALRGAWRVARPRA